MFMHGAKFYFVIMLAVPVVLAAISRASGNRWAATIITGTYTVFCRNVHEILQLFPAMPKLGPVYQNDHAFVPPDFPLLLIVPAIVFDFPRPYTGWNRWAQAAILGAAFASKSLSPFNGPSPISSVPSLAQLVFRHQQLALLHPARFSLGPQRLVSHRTQPRTICPDHASSPGRRHPHDPRRPKLGRLDAPHPSLTRFFLLISLF